MKHLEKIANIAVIVAVVCFLAVLIRGGILKHLRHAISPQSLVGSKLEIPGIHLEAQDTFVIALSVSCRFCQESLPFYKQLANRSQGKADVIAILPQSQLASETFIRDAHLQNVRVVSMDLAKIGVSATPTLLLADQKGNVQKEWVGLLSSKSEQEILANISQ